MATLLATASQAISILANTSEPSTTLSSQKAAFERQASLYFETLSSIEVRLRRQIYALEEAGLIAPGDQREAKRGRAVGGDEVSAGAGGPLDVSWLNARAKDTVGKNMERELWAKTRQLIEHLRMQRPVAEDSVEPSEARDGHVQKLEEAEQSGRG